MIFRCFAELRSAGHWFGKCGELSGESDIHMGTRWAVVVADLLCAVLLAVFCALVIFFTDMPRGYEVPLLLAYALWIGFANRFWHAKDRSSEPVNWMSDAFISVLVALVFLVIFRVGAYLMFGVVSHEQESIASKIFDFGVVLICCPGMTMAYLLGWFRAGLLKNKWFLQRLSSS